MKSHHLLALAVLTVLSTVGVHADSIHEVGFLPDPPNTNATLPANDVIVNLSNSDAWAYYANGAAVTTDAANLGNFSSMSGPLVTVAGGFLFVSYTGGVGGANPASQTDTNAHDNTLETFSLTTKLFAPTEELSFYLLSFDTTADITVTVGSATFSLTNTPLPLLTVPNGSLTDGTSNRQGTLILDISGTVGDVVTFTENPDSTGVSNPAVGNVSLIAVTADAVPEPTTYALLLGGLGLLFFGVRRLRAVSI